MRFGTAVSETRGPSTRFTVETRGFLTKIRQAYPACSDFVHEVCALQCIIVKFRMLQIEDTR